MLSAGASDDPTSAIASKSRFDDLVILIPLFNDWTSAKLLLDRVDDVLARDGRQARILLVDDASTIPISDDTTPRGGRAVRRIDVLQLRRNLGHQRAIAVGLAYVEHSFSCRALVLMDGDGEDAPSDLPRLLARSEANPEEVVFAERTRRTESWKFVFFYALYKFVHRLLTGQGVRVGNFSVVPAARLSSLVVVSEIWNHYAAAVLRSRQPYSMVPTERGTRLHGESKMNFTRLVVHGLSAISVYSDIIGVRLLLTTMVFMGLAFFGLLGVLGVQMLTTLAVPGWATSALGLTLIVLLQTAMFSIVFCFIILGSRQGSSFLPARDYAYYIRDLATIWDNAAAESSKCSGPTDVAGDLRTASTKS